MNLREWTKRLGQKHWYVKGDSKTVCGMPMLGNNYSHYEEHEKTECKKCKEFRLQLSLEG